MVKEKLSDPNTYLQVIHGMAKYLILLPQSRVRIIDPRPTLLQTARP